MKTLKASLLLGMGVMVAIAYSSYAAEDINEYETRIAITDPNEICFLQKRAIGDLDNMTLQYFLTVPPEHHGKHGGVFVGARLNSQPGRTWISTGSTNDWYEPGTEGAPFPMPSPYSNNTILKPVHPITVFGKPVNLSSYEEDGEIWIGYGLSEPKGLDKYNESMQEAYDEMIASGRFKKVWTAGEWPGSVELCLNVRELIIRDPSKSPTLQNPVILPVTCSEDNLGCQTAQNPVILP